MKMTFFAALLALQLAGLPVCSAADVVSGSPSASLSAGGNSFRPVISADGARVVFMSHANNLVTNDNGREWLDLFVRDQVASNTVLVSVTTSGVGGGNGNSFAATVSSNGQFIAFVSEASDLINGDTNGASDVFVRDVMAGTTRLVSTDTSGNSPADERFAFYAFIPLSNNPMLSADGRWVFFESRARTLTLLPDANDAVDVFARDLQSNVTVLVSRRYEPEAANAGSELAGITPDGKRVVFISKATNMVLGARNPLGDIYVRDMLSNVTYWASGSLGYSNGYRCVNAALSESGRYVAFTVVPTDGPSAVYRRDLDTYTTVPIGMNVWARATPQISAHRR